MKYYLVIALALSFNANCFELDEYSVNDDGKKLSAQSEVQSIYIEHDKKKGKLENNESNALKLEGINRNDIETIEKATNIFKP